MSYLLHYPLLLPIANQIDANGATLTVEQTAEALRILADRLEANPDMLENTLGREPVASFPEDRWVLRALGRKNIIRAADGGWIDITSGYVAAQHTRSSKQIVERNLDPGPVGVWDRPEDVFSQAIPITLLGRGSSELPLRLRRFSGRGGLTRARQPMTPAIPGYLPARRADTGI